MGKADGKKKNREYRCCVIPKILKMLLAIELSIGRPKKGKKQRKCLSPKQAKLISCTMVLQDKRGIIQGAGSQLPGDRLNWLQ